MNRIVYLSFPDATIRGGQKMILRHVETLRDLGFDAVCFMLPDASPPAWFERRAPIERGLAAPEGVLVLPDDAPNAIVTVAGMDRRAVIMCQGLLGMGIAAEAIDRFPAARFPTFLTVGRMLSDQVRRFYPQAQVELVRCFADERVFRPGAGADEAIAFSPRKRPEEAMFILKALRKLHPRHEAWAWRRMENLPETAVAGIMASSKVFLSLSRLESVGMTPLEAMACGSFCAGFAGIGGEEYATPENGVWAPEDDCMAAADALAQACDVARSGGPELARRLEAGFETAREWSYARFRQALEETWMRLAPEARIRNGPLDA